MWRARNRDTGRYRALTEAGPDGRKRPLWSRVGAPADGGGRTGEQEPGPGSDYTGTLRPDLSVVAGRENRTPPRPRKFSEELRGITPNMLLPEDFKPFASTISPPRPPACPSNRR